MTLHCIDISCFLKCLVSACCKALRLSELNKALLTYMLWYLGAVAPEAVWQVGRPPYQSEIWYGSAIAIRDAGISLVLIPTNSLLHYFFHSTSLSITFTNRHLNSAYLPTY